MMYFISTLLVILLIMILLILGFVVGHDDGTDNDGAAAGNVMADPQGWTYSQVYDATGTLRLGPSTHTSLLADYPSRLTPRPSHGRGQGAGT